MIQVTGFDFALETTIKSPRQSQTAMEKDQLELITSTLVLYRLFNERVLPTLTWTLRMNDG